MKQKLLMRHSNFRRMMNKGIIPTCYAQGCNKKIQVGDLYVKGRSFSSPKKIYCVPCADRLNII